MSAEAGLLIEAMAERLTPFRYDFGARVFHLGGLEIPAPDFDPFEAMLDVAPSEIGVSPDDIKEVPLLIDTFGVLIATRRFHDALKDRPELATLAVESMVDVFNQPGGEFSEEGLWRLAENPSHVGFNVTVGQKGKAHFQVLGNCACLHYNPDSAYAPINYDFDGGCAEYTLHNADNQPQISALYAGAGRIASLALGLEPVQLRLL